MMINFDKISVKQILLLSEIISGSTLMQREFIEQKYSRNALNFKETIDLMTQLNLLEIRANRVTVKQKYREFLKALKLTEQPTQLVREFIVSRLFNQPTSFSEYLNEFMSKFHFKDEHCEFKPDAVERLEYSGLRNFLMDLEFLRLDPTEIKYTIVPEYALIYADLIEPEHLSLNEFNKIQQKRLEIGKNAELQILEYEKRRLRKLPQLVEKIEHTSVKDVAAGYDVKSFESKQSRNGLPILRFIEVKAVTSIDYRFYWTRNEIEVSKRLNNNYYLYLLPISGKNGFDLQGLKTIKNPYLNVYENNIEWVRVNELIAFSFIKVT